MSTRIKMIKLLLLVLLLATLGPWSNAQVVVATGWPGSTAIAKADRVNQGLGKNTSGITYQAPTPTQENLGYLWIVKNDPPTLFKMELDSAGLYINSEGWKGGRALTYKNGKGKPDAEGVTWVENFIYVATEKRKPAWSIFPRSKRQLSILRYDVSKTDKKLEATHEWNLARDIEDSVEKIDSNKGWEAITWIPDTDLESKEFKDRLGQLYDGGKYADHFGGLFFAGLEQNGGIYAYLLIENEDECPNKNECYERIADFSSDMEHVVGLEYDRKRKVLWANCDNSCANQNELRVFDIDSSGKFDIKKIYKKPDGIKTDSNFEGITFLPDTKCDSSPKNFLWVDDDGEEENSIFSGIFQCP